MVNVDRGFAGAFRCADGEARIAQRATRLAGKSETELTRIDNRLVILS